LWEIPSHIQPAQCITLRAFDHADAAFPARLVRFDAEQRLVEKFEIGVDKGLRQETAIGFDQV
jgi:hypothetical protein